MDIYKDGYIYTDYYEVTYPAVADKSEAVSTSWREKYPCPQPHPDWEDGEDVTGKYELRVIEPELINGIKDRYTIAVPIPTEQPTVKGVDVNGDEYPRLPLDAPTEQPKMTIFYCQSEVDGRGRCSTQCTDCINEYATSPTEQPSGIVLGKVERLNPDGSKTIISDGYSAQKPKEQSDYWKRRCLAAEKLIGDDAYEFGQPYEDWHIIKEQEPTPLKH